MHSVENIQTQRDEGKFSAIVFVDLKKTFTPSQTRLL